jgi:hypothetical protein
MPVDAKDCAFSVEQVALTSAAQNAWATTYSVDPVLYQIIDALHFTSFR